MDEFFEKDNLESVNVEVETQRESNTQESQCEQSEHIYNPINYTDVKAITDYKPISKGLKVFSLIMAAVILLTSASLAGYFLGKNSNSFVSEKNVNVNLAAKPADTDEMTAAQVYEKVNKSVVGIAIYNAEGNGSQASGVFYSEDGYIVTNDHVYSEVSSPKFKVYTSDGKEYEAEYIAGDKVSDLAVLKIKSGKFEVAEFGDSNSLVCGESVVAIGRPNDATRSSSITKGIISVTSRRVQTTSSYSARLIQTDSAINPGSSGGALVNMYGQIIGITSSKLASVEYDAVGYAIPTTTVKRIVDELINRGKIETRAKLGISYNAINSIAAEISGYSSTGILVADVSADSDLYGKIEKGDLITYINDVQITSDDVVLDFIDTCSAGDTISVTFVTSSGDTKTVNAKLKANISESSFTTQSVSPSEKSDSSGGGSKDNSENGGTFNFPFGE